MTAGLALLRVGAAASATRRRALTFVRRLPPRARASVRFNTPRKVRREEKSVTEYAPYHPSDYANKALRERSCISSAHLEA